MRSLDLDLHILSLFVNLFSTAGILVVLSQKLVLFFLLETTSWDMTVTKVCVIVFVRLDKTIYHCRSNIKLT